MGTTPLIQPAHSSTAEELRQLPPEQRDAILAAAADRAMADYADPALTAFEAFGPGDLYGDSGDAQPR